MVSMHLGQVIDCYFFIFLFLLHDYKPTLYDYNYKVHINIPNDKIIRKMGIIKRMKIMELMIMTKK